MASISSLIISFDPFSRNKTIRPNSNKSIRTKAFAASREAHNGKYSSGRLVDENLIVLRKRIHEVKVVERNYEPPMEWMEWEKRIYTTYDSMICDAMGHLQSCLMETRPSLVLAIIALVTLSVPTSFAVVMFNFLQLTTKGLH